MGACAFVGLVRNGVAALVTPTALIRRYPGFEVIYVEVLRLLTNHIEELREAGHVQGEEFIPPPEVWDMHILRQHSPHGSSSNVSGAVFSDHQV